MRSMPARPKPDTTGNGAIVLREMYPMKSDLYDRARGLKEEYQTGSRK